jgi:hypothetical protein
LLGKLEGVPLTRVYYSSLDMCRVKIEWKKSNSSERHCQVICDVENWIRGLRGARPPELSKTPALVLIQIGRSFPTELARGRSDEYT